MHWIYLSPHLDDAALSCGGLIWEQSQAGEPAKIWTICAGDPPLGDISRFAKQLQARWQTGVEAGPHRRAEDRAACQILGAECRHLPIPDCIYRRGGARKEPLYTSEESLFGPLHPADEALRASMSDGLAVDLQRLDGPLQVVCPWGLGEHVDHRLTRAAAEDLGQPLWYYADYPYVVRQPGLLDEILRLPLERQVFAVSEAGLLAWERSIMAHASQISTFWASLDEMRAALRAYVSRVGGVPLWRATGCK